MCWRILKPRRVKNLQCTYNTMQRISVWGVGIPYEKLDERIIATKMTQGVLSKYKTEYPITKILKFRERKGI